MECEKRLTRSHHGGDGSVIDFHITGGDYSCEEL